jgi:small-conductance mechanosensitive channel
MLDLGPLNVLTDYDLLGAIVIILASLLIAKFVNLILVVIVHHFAKKTKTTLDDELVRAVVRPIFLIILLLGLYLATESIDFLSTYSLLLDRIAVVLAVLVAFYAIVRIVNALFRWYAAEVAVKTKTELDEKYISIFKRVLDIVLYIIAGMIILKYLGIEITPLLAGLGIGGLAIALGLQDTLTNFFAGFYILTDKSIRIGDYVELENKLGGYIDDISWRTTRIRTLADNYVIIPNSKLSQSITTNYYFGKHEMALVIPVEVAYHNNLEKVEKVTVSVAKSVQKSVEGAVKSFEPFVRFSEFAASNIKFSVILKVNKFADQYVVRHEFIKKLKKEYDHLNIEISYPTRNVYIRK